MNLSSRDGGRFRLLSMANMEPNHQQNRPPLEDRNLIANQDHSNSKPTPPMQPRASLRYHPNARSWEEERENGYSSPSVMSHSSEDRAYMQSNRPISPQQPSRRISLLPSCGARAPNNDLQQRTPPTTQPLPTMGANRNIVQMEIRSALLKFEDAMSESAQELERCRSQVAALTRELETANSEVSRLKPALATCREAIVAKDTELASVKSCLAEIESKLGVLKADRATAIEERNLLRNEKEVLGKTLENTKSKTTTLINNFSDLGQTFKELKKAHDDSQRQLYDLSKELQETRKCATNGLAAMQPMLDDQGTLARAAETKAILKELQEDLSSSRQVIYQLREKLLISGSQLIDTQERVRELEEEKRGALQRLLSASEEEKLQFELLFRVEEKVAVLSERLSAREREAFDLLANAATMESELKVAKAEIETLKTAQDAHVAELEALRIIKEEHLSKLLALQDIINARDKEGIALRGEVKALNESKAELRALLAESKNELAQKSTELQERNPNEELIEKICDLKATKEILDVRIQELEEKIGTSASLLKGAEQKYEALCRTSRNQEAVEKTNAELSSANALLRTLLEEAQESLKKSLLASGKCQALEQEVVELKGRLDVQSVSLFQSKEEVSALNERVNSLTNQLRLAQPASEEAATLRERVNPLSTQLSAADANASAVDTLVQSADSDDLDGKSLSELSRLPELDDEQEQPGLAAKAPAPQHRPSLDTATTTNKRVRSPSPQGEDLNLSFSKRRAGTNPKVKPAIGQPGQVQASSASAASSSAVKKVSDNVSRLANANIKSKLRKRK